MAGKKSETFEVECPCCQAKLKIDPGVKAVLSYEERPEQRSIEDLSAGLDRLKREQAARATAFDKRFEAVKSEKDVLSRKFDELLKQAKESPEKGPPVKRPFDLD
jgi:hypothetical protein